MLHRSEHSGARVRHKLTQAERVLRALRHAGRRGLTAVDFLAPSTVDGGPPILRLPARIAELKAAGHTITAAGRRDKCRVYRLVSDPASPTPAVAVAEPAHALFEQSASSQPLSPYDPRAEA